MKTLACGAVVLLMWLFVAPVHAVTGAEAEFVRAYRSYSEGDHSRAAALFRSARSDAGFVLQDYALYYLARIATDAGKHDDARGHLETLKKSFPRSIWSTEASFLRVELDLAQKRHQAAIRAAAALKKTVSGREPRARAAYYLGQAHEAVGKDRKAYAFHQEARRRGPRSAWGNRARERVRELRRKHPKRLGLRNGDAMLREARQLQKERDYPAAADLYQRILRETNYRRLSLDGLAAVYRKMRLRDEEEQVLRRYVRHYPKRDRAGKALTRIAIIQWNRDDNAGALKTLREFRRKYPGHIRKRFAIYIIGRIHESMGQREAAIRTYRLLFAKEHRYSRFRNDAAWRLAWIHYRRADHKAARALFRDIAGRHGNFRLAATFWEGRTAEKLKESVAARRLYRRVVKKDPDSYYALLASQRLQGLGVELPDPAPPKRARKKAGTPRLGARATFHLARARALARLGLHPLAHPELDRVRRHSKRTTALKLLLMREYARARAYHRSLSLAQQSPPSLETLRLQYPLAHWDAVRRHSTENGLDPYLILSLMRQESMFKHKAMSPANALGLMQLLHETARKEASLMGLPAPEVRQLFDPDLNIQLGAHHLKGLLERYDNSQAKALAAYNAGKEAVERWTRDLGSADDLEFIERISYRETRGYVKAVLRNYHAYRTLYGKVPPERAGNPAS
ncbi:MAG: transglycosylase SLT domain-containing protein [Deltaproteobacteria bacterium]|nr:transglycosylase SLT domain-containing protein [Deltaproteobacteria bacterium]